jgi:hypothetical protein
MSMTMSRGGNMPASAYAFQWMVASAKWADTIGPVVLGGLRAAAPVGQPQEVTNSSPLATRHRIGNLRDSIRYSKDASETVTTATFTAYVPYAGYVIEGTRAHEIWPKSAKYLHFASRGTEYFVGPKGTQAHVNHPGTAPNPFNRRVIEELMDWIQETYTEIMQEALGE